MTADARRRRQAAGRPLRGGPRRADLPDLGAHLRVQPRVRALPVELRAAATRASSRTAECKAVIDELERMQVFYVNIGGGEPTVRRDFWELVDYATDHHVGVKFSTNGSRIDRGARRAARGQRLRRRADLARRRDRRGQRRGARRRAPTPPRSARWSNLARGRVRRLQAVGRRDPAQRRPARRVQGDRRPLRRAAADHPAAPVGPRRRRLGRAAPDRRAAARALRLAGAPTARTCSPATRSSTSRRSARRCPA